MTDVDPRDRADDLLVEALLHRLGDPRDHGPEVKAALDRTAHTRPHARGRWLQASLGLAAAAVTVLVLVLAKAGGSEAERWLDRALHRAEELADREYRVGVLDTPLQARLVLRGSSRMLLEVRGPLDNFAFRAGIGRDGAWSIPPVGGVEAGPLEDFGADHPLANFADVVARSLRTLRAAPDVEFVPGPGGNAALRSAREGLQVVIAGGSDEVERLELPWIVGRLDFVRQAGGAKQDLVYEHTSYHAPGEPVRAPSGEFSLGSLFGLDGLRPRNR